MLLIALGAGAQGIKDFRPGRYYDNSGNRHDGFIKYKYNNKRKIYFRAGPNEKAISLRPDDLKSFVVKADSFMVLRNFYLDRKKPGGRMPADFAKVVEPGPLTLVRHYSIQKSDYYGYAAPTAGNYVGIEGVKTYYLVSLPSNAVTVVNFDRDLFKTNMASFFSGVPEIAEKIRNGKYLWEDMPEVVRLYNQQVSNREN
ncbi:hypothetical protein D770_06785 [Flammeovirgaceae bacterium 311]|nr:hypothetical protein D770_06785 [Flammeovirgaceae bacterium 311]